MSVVEKCPHCGRQIVQRSHEQNDLFHALVDDISKQKQWAGRWLEPEQWKRLLIAAFERTQGRHAEVFPALDGHGFDVVYRRSSRMSRQEASALVEYVFAWAAENGVHFHLPEAT